LDTHDVTIQHYTLEKRLTLEDYYFKRCTLHLLLYV